MHRGSAIFLLVFLSTTSEKSFIPWKASAAVQALKVGPIRPRVLSSWGINLIEKLRAAQLCAYYDSSCFAAAGLVVDLAT